MDEILSIGLSNAKQVSFSIYIYYSFLQRLKVDAILYARTPGHLDNIMHMNMTVHPSIIGVEWKLITLLLLSLSL